MTKRQIIEEPCEVKVSRTVLKTSGTGDSLAEFNNLMYANLQRANLTAADLTRANLKNAKLDNRTNLTSATLICVNLVGNLWGVLHHCR